MSKRLNVLYITSWYPHKTNPVEGVFVREHAKAASLFHNIVVMHLANRAESYQHPNLIERENETELTESIPTFHVYSRHSPIPKTNYLASLLSVISAYRTILASGFQPDVIHAHIYSAGVPAVILGKLYRLPVVITEHNSAFPRNLLPSLEIRKARIAFSQSDLVLPVSAALQKAIEGHGIEANFKVIPNVVNTDLFYPGGEHRAHDQEKRVIFVGSLLPVKGIEYLLQALAQMSVSLPNWHLDIIGEGPEKQRYQELCKKLNIESQVTFRGRLPKPQVAGCLRQSDLFVLPSLWENQPCALIEAMACGLPVISTNTGGIPETVDRTVGILVPPKNAEALANAIQQAITGKMVFDPDSIREKALRYNPQVIGSELSSIYQNLVSK